MRLAQLSRCLLPGGYKSAHSIGRCSLSTDAELASGRSVRSNKQREDHIEMLNRQNPVGPRNAQRPSQSNNNNGRPLSAQMRGLFQRHGVEIRRNKAKDEYSLLALLERIEWTEIATPAQLNDIIRMLRAGPPPGQLGRPSEWIDDRQAAVLISATGRMCPGMSKERRAEMTIAIGNELKNLGFNLRLRTMNAVLAARVDNDIQLDVAKVLETFERAAIEPDRETFEILAKSYAKNDDANGILEIINFLKRSGKMLVTKDLIGSLIYASSKKGNEAEVNSLIEKFGTDTNSTIVLRIASAMGYFGHGNMTEAVAQLEQLTEEEREFLIKNKTLHSLILEPYLEMLERRDFQAAEALKPYIPLDAKGQLMDANFTAVIGKMRLFQTGNFRAAIQLLPLMPDACLDKVKFANSKELIENCLNENMTPTDLLTLAQQIENDGIGSKILLQISQAAYRGGNMEVFFNAYDAIAMDPQYDSIKKRPQFIVPGLIRRLTALEDKLDPAKKLSICIEAMELFLTEKMQSLANVVLDKFKNDFNLLSRLIDRISPQNQSDMAYVVVTQMLYMGKYDYLRELLSGKLSEISMPYSRQLHDLIMRAVKEEPGTWHPDMAICMAQIIAMVWRRESNLRRNLVSETLVTILLSSEISDENISSLLKALKKQKNFELDSNERRRLEEELAMNDQSKRVRMLGLLAADDTIKNANRSIAENTVTHKTVNKKTETATQWEKLIQSRTTPIPIAPFDSVPRDAKYTPERPVWFGSIKPKIATTTTVDVKVAAAVTTPITSSSSLDQQQQAKPSSTKIWLAQRPIEKSLWIHQRQSSLAHAPLRPDNKDRDQQLPIEEEDAQKAKLKKSISHLTDLTGSFAFN